MTEIQTLDRLVAAFERIATALERMSPPFPLWTVGGSPMNPPYIPPSPYVSPTKPYGDLPGWLSNPQITCGGNIQSAPGAVCINAMTQADGQGDDSGTRGD